MMETGAEIAVRSCTEQEFGEFMKSDGTKIIWSIIHRYGSGLEYEEAFQELQIALWRALSAYKPTKKTKKTTFVYAAVYNRLKMMIRESNAEKRRTERQNQSTSTETYHERSDHTYNMEEQVVEDMVLESRANALHWAIRNGGLTEEERIVMTRTLQDVQQKDIGEELGCSQGHVSVLKARAIEKIKVAMQDAQWDGESIWVC